MKRLNEILQEERERCGMTRENVNRQTKIARLHLIALEEGKWSEFPSFGYLSSLVRRYAQAIGMSQERAVSLLRRDCDEKKNRFIRTSHYERASLRSVPIALIAVSIIIGVFILFQLRSVMVKPRLDLQTTPQSIQRRDAFVVSGSTDQGVLLYLNKERIFQNERGIFRQELYLRPGKQQLELVAIGPNGREDRRLITVDVTEN